MFYNKVAKATEMEKFMSFDVGGKPPSKSSKFDHQQAISLYNSLKLKKYVARGTRFSPSKWGIYFTKLRRSYSKEDISSVLEFYSSHIGEEFIPIVQSARSFQEKFERIHAAMKKHESNPTLVKVEITPIAHKAQQRLCFDWPTNEKKDELKFLQLTFNYLQGFHDRLKKLMLDEEAIVKEIEAKSKGKRDSKDYRFSRLVSYVYWHISTPYEMTLWWTDIVHTWSWQWEGYSGHLLSRVLSDNTEYWNKYCSRIVAQYRGDGGDWELIVNRLKEMDV